MEIYLDDISGCSQQRNPCHHRSNLCFSYVSTCPTPSPRMEVTRQNDIVLLLKMCACGTFIPVLSVKIEFSCTLSTAANHSSRAESENSRSILPYTRSGQSTSAVLNSVLMNKK